MSYIIGKPCEATCDTACVSVCPVDCIHGPIDIDGAGQEVAGMTIGPKDMLYINPDECIDCGACLPECPVEAIYEDEDEGDTFAISKTIRFYSNAIAMPFFITILKKGGGAET